MVMPPRRWPPFGGEGHSVHPGIGEVAAQAIEAAIKATSLYPGIFSILPGGNRSFGEAMLQHSFICAVGFIGSLGGSQARSPLSWGG